MAVCAKCVITLHRVGGLTHPAHLEDLADYDITASSVSSITHVMTQRDVDKMLVDKMEALSVRAQESKDKEHEELEHIAEEAEKARQKSTVSKVQMLKIFRHAIAKNADVSADLMASNSAQRSMDYAASVAGILLTKQNFNPTEWQDLFIAPYLSAFLDSKVSQATCSAILAKCEEIVDENEDEEEDDEDGDVLCDVKFSLAYGGMILLRKAHLKLLRGHRYGICGHNGCGKTTLLRALAAGQVEGFPHDRLKVVMVAHDLDSSVSDTPIAQFLMQDERLKGVSKETIFKELENLGFDEEMSSMGVGSLSGGWKMKLALLRAILMNADLLLLDEPTNHLDRKSVEWLQNYLTNLPNLTSIIISHDTGFLDAVCDHIIHYNNRKLRIYRGNLEEFVKVRFFY